MKLVLYPNTILREKTTPVEEVNDEIREFVQEMFSILEEEGGLGLAANQVGSTDSIFIIKTEKEEYTFINPEIIETEGTQYNYEGCLSLPGIQERVYRPYRLVVRAQDINGKIFTLDTKTNDLLAQVIQHEYDHIQGILMLDHFDQIQMDRAKNTLKKLEKLQKMTKRMALKSGDKKKKPKKH